MFSITSALALTSCDNDDNENHQDSVLILPKAIKFTDEANPTAEENTVFVYDGNKIVSATSERKRKEYTYDGNVIANEKCYNILDGKNELLYNVDYKYANNKLVAATYSEGFSTEFPTGRYLSIVGYQHNYDGTVRKSTISSDKAIGLDAQLSEYTYTYANGNLVKKERIDLHEGSTFQTELYSYEYDSKNSPFKNVLGFDLLIDYEECSFGNNSNNSISCTEDRGTKSRNNYRTFTYEFGYPTEVTQKIPGSNMKSTKKAYEITYSIKTIQ